ncbi:MAG: ECF transporter S component [Epulopiscium sp.]|nr:ECF transporter S component [Candidatus Epulonipiscium sp.]
MLEENKTKKMALLGIFIAIILALAFSGIGYIPLGFMNATIVHIPVIVGSILLGPKEGMILGLVFGLTSIINNTFKPNVTSYVFSPFYSVGEAKGNFWSIVIAIFPRMMIGVTTYYTYKGLGAKLRSKEVSYFIAGVVGSITNTILVMSGIYVFFGQSYAATQGVLLEGLFGMILTVILINGIPEAIVAGIISLALCRALTPVMKKQIA